MSDEQRVFERAQSDVERAVLKGAAGDFEESLALFDAIVREHGGAAEPLLRCVVASACFNRAVTFRYMGRNVQANEALRELVRRFEHDRHVVVARSVCRALFNLSLDVVREAREPGEAIAFYEDIVRRCDAHRDEELLGIGCDVLSNLALYCEQNGQADRTVAVCDQLLGRLGPAPGAARTWHLLNALGCKAMALGDLGQSELALATMDAALDVVRSYDSPQRTERMVCLLNNKGNLLLEVKRYVDAARVFEASYEASRGRSEPDVVVYGAQALMNHALALQLHGASDAALAAFDRVAHRFAGRPDPRLTEVAVKSLVFRRDLLSMAGRHDEASAVEAQLDALGEQLRDADQQQLAARALFEHARATSGLDDRVQLLDAVVDTLKKHPGSGHDEAMSARALAFKGLDLARAGRTGEAIATWDDVIARLSSRTDDEAVELLAQTLLNRARALTTLGCAEEALAGFEDVVRRFGQLRATATSTALAAREEAVEFQRWLMERRARQPQPNTLPETRAALDDIDKRIRSAPPVRERPHFVQARVAEGTLAAQFSYATHDRSRHQVGETGWALVVNVVEKVRMEYGRRPSALVVESRPTLGAPSLVDSNFHLMVEGMAVFGLPMHAAAQCTHIGLCSEWLGYPLKETFVATGVACLCHFEAREAQS